MDAENTIVAIKQLSLKVLSPRIRLLIIVLESLLNEKQDIRGIRLDCMRYGFSCRNLEGVLRELEEDGIITRERDGKYILTDYGRELSEVMQSICNEIQDFVKKSYKGEVKENDVYSLLFTPIAGILGLAEADLEERDLFRALGLTTYLTTLVSTALGLISSSNPVIKNLVKEIEHGFIGVQ